MNTKVRPIRIDGDVAYVPLTRGYEAIIDSADVPLIAGHNWSALVSPRRRAVYAVRVVRKTMLLMHRIMSGIADGLEVDHVDCDGLNNRRENLRHCTRAENVRNTGIRSDNKSGFKGVCFEARAGKWRAEIRTGGKTRYLGYFDSAELAAAARNTAAAQDHGKFARQS